MKLRNKKTGEICEFMIHKRIKDSKDGNPVYAPFNDSVEDWEDYEEPKEFWYICDFRVIRGIEGKLSFTREEIAKMKSIGNYFETEEEAEKAVEKLKAWTRLKDKGFKFVSFSVGNRRIEFDIPTPKFTTAYDAIEFEKSFVKDLDLLFGGEE